MAYQSRRFMRDPRMRGIFQRFMNNRRRPAPTAPIRTPLVPSVPMQDNPNAGPRQPPKPATQLPPISGQGPVGAIAPAPTPTIHPPPTVGYPAPAPIPHIQPVKPPTQQPPTNPHRQPPGMDRNFMQAFNRFRGKNRAPAWSRKPDAMRNYLGIGNSGQAKQNVYRNQSNEQAGLSQPKSPITNPFGINTKGRGV